MRNYLLTLSLLTAVSIPAMAADRPPNIIFILADDLGWGDVGFNGRTEWRTPKLDRLAREGTVFRRWYAPAVVCAPSRAALLTGKYGIHNGVTANNDDLPANEVTIAQALKAQGYATALFGKWHEGQPRPGHTTPIHPLDRGFDEFFGFTNAVHAWEQYPRQLWFGRESKPVSGYANTLFTDRGIEFIKSHKDRPFFLYLPYIATHFHIQAPPEDVAEHKGKFKEKEPNKPLNATYAAMVTRLDKEVGRIMQSLDEMGLAKDTLIVFSSDHGATFEEGNQGTSAYHDSNRPFRGGKRTLWEGGIRVPGVVRWPGKIPAGKVSSDSMPMLDLLPTMLAAAGGSVRKEWKLDGHNMLPFWRGETAAPDRILFWEWRSEGYLQLAAMRGKFKMVVTGGNRPELFDVEVDPAERRNIIEQESTLARQLRQELQVWLSTETEAARWGKTRSRPPRSGT